MNKIHFRSAIAFLALTAVVAGCDNPVSDDDDDHAVPSGIVIRAGTTEMIRVVGFQNPVVTGALTVSAGGQSPVLRATYIDSEGDDITLVDEYYLGVASVSSATATWQGTAEGAFTGRVIGHEAGATTLGFQLYHGPLGGGHPEPRGAYVVPVTVTATQP